MRKFFIAIGLLGAAGGVALASASFLSRQEFMPLEKAEKRYGAKKFDASEFKKGGEKSRAAMAVSLVRSRRYVGLPFNKVREELGDWDGYFETDSIPAYFIDSSTDPKKDSWQLLFLPDKTGNAVGEVKIHKN